LAYCVNVCWTVLNNVGIGTDDLATYHPAFMAPSLNIVGSRPGLNLENSSGTLTTIRLKGTAAQGEMHLNFNGSSCTAGSLSFYTYGCANREVLTIGLNGINAIESLQNIGLENDELFDIIKSIADKNKDSADAMPAEPAILLWLKDYDPEAFVKLSKDTNSSSTNDTNADSKNISESKKKVKNDIDEMILSFFNREDGDFPLGETGVITKVKKEFGDKFEPYITKKVFAYSRQNR
jgi:hypothetical protein